MFLSFGKYKQEEEKRKRRSQSANKRNSLTKPRKSQTFETIQIQRTNSGAGRLKPEVQTRQRAQSFAGDGQDFDAGDFSLPGAPDDSSPVVPAAESWSGDQQPHTPAELKYSAPLLISAKVKPEKVLYLTIKGPKTISLAVGQTDTVNFLKEKLAEIFDFEDANFTLWLQKREIKSGKSLAHYNLKDDYVLRIAF